MNTCEQKLKQIAALITAAEPTYGTDQELTVLATTVGLIQMVIDGSITYDIESGTVTKLSG